MSRRYLTPMAEITRQRAVAGRRSLRRHPYRPAWLHARLWDAAPAGRRVLRYYRPAATPLWVDDLALWRNLRARYPR